MGELVGNDIKYCASKCIFGDTPACEECLKEHAIGPFETCSGLVPEETNYL